MRQSSKSSLHVLLYEQYKPKDYEWDGFRVVIKVYRDTTARNGHQGYREGAKPLSCTSKRDDVAAGITPRYGVMFAGKRNSFCNIN